MAGTRGLRGDVAGADRPVPCWARDPRRVGGDGDAREWRTEKVRELERPSWRRGRRAASVVGDAAARRLVGREPQPEGRHDDGPAKTNCRGRSSHPTSSPRQHANIEARRPCRGATPPSSGAATKVQTDGQVTPRCTSGLGGVDAPARATPSPSDTRLRGPAQPIHCASSPRPREAPTSARTTSSPPPARTSTGGSSTRATAPASAGTATARTKPASSATSPSPAAKTNSLVRLGKTSPDSHQLDYAGDNEWNGVTITKEKPPSTVPRPGDGRRGCGTSSARRARRRSRMRRGCARGCARNDGPVTSARDDDNARDARMMRG